MRHSNHAGRGRRLPLWAAGLFVVIVVGCGSSPQASAPPSAAPTPVVTPDPHLKEPVTADEIYRDLGRGGLKISAVNANLGQGNPDIVKQINADLGGWPLRIIEYRTSAVLVRALAWTPGQAPGGDEAPYAFAALNVLITFGPISARAPTAPEPARAQAAATLVAILDPLLWPLGQRSVAAIPSRTPIPAATPVPTVKPSVKPSTKPTAKPTPKPTKKP